MHLLDETTMTLGQISEETGASYWAVYRWATVGCRDGVLLETARLGGKIISSREAVRRFVDRCTELADGQTPPSSPDVRPSRAASTTSTRRPKRRRIRLETRADQADREARAAGL